MPLPIEDYALIGDCHTAALVGRDGSIDWLCLPRFDADACFAALLGGPEHGRWLIAPAGATPARTRRRYRDGTLILETTFETDEGVVRLIDCMPLSDQRDILRIVEGVRGRVRIGMELVVRFGYGAIVPWVRRPDGTLLITAGPDTLELHARVPTRGVDMRTVADFEIDAGDRVPFVLNYRPSHEETHAAIDPEAALQRTEEAWHAWSARCRYRGRWQAQVLRSLITLKALTYEPTGGIVAAATTSLPEHLGGVRNWDYRYCWLRDAAFTLNALLLTGYRDEAEAWREWLLRAVAGSPQDLQILYGVTGVRRLDERELEWLPGYAGSRPVRIGNAAASQYQLDVYGEVMDTLHLSRAAGLPPEPHAWQIQRAVLDFLSAHWQAPDEGIWEIRGPRQHFTHSKVMAWVAFDRAVRDVERYGLEGPVEAWRRTRDEIHAQVCEQGFDARLNSFIQHYGATGLDASLLMIPLVGFLPVADPRVRGTIEAVQRELTRRRAGAALPHAHRCRRTAARRGHLPAVHPLAGRLPGAERAARRGRRAVRTGARAVQRRRPAGRGVRPARRPHARQLSAGAVAHGARQHGPAAVDVAGRDRALVGAARPAADRRRRGRRPGRFIGPGLVPVADLDVARRGPALAGLDEVLEAQKERGPLGAAVRGELDRLAPAAVAEVHDAVLALLRELELDVGADPFVRTRRAAPVHGLVRVQRGDLHAETADGFAARCAEVEIDGAAGLADAGGLLRPPARHPVDGRECVVDLRDGGLDAHPVNDVDHVLLRGVLNG